MKMTVQQKKLMDGLFTQWDKASDKTLNAIWACMRKKEGAQEQYKQCNLEEHNVIKTVLKEIEQIAFDN